MFQVDDYVVYGSSGVCKVLEIGTPDIHGIDKSKLYYMLQPVYSKGSVIYIPVENEKSNIRNVISKDEALSLINDIPNIDVIQVPNEKLQAVIYKETLRKNDCREWIKVIKTLYLKNQRRLSEGKKIGNSDMKYLHEAEESLYGELSIPLAIPKDEMEGFIADQVNHLKMS
jgi:CarD family transcriptional regulator